MRFPTFLLISFLALSACDDHTSAPAKAQKAAAADATAEEWSGLHGPIEDARANARASVRLYVKTHVPNLEIEGLSAISIDERNFVVAVDPKGSIEKSMMFVSREFFRDDGTGYWKVEPLSPQTAALYGLLWDRTRSREEGAPSGWGLKTGGDQADQ